METNELDLHDLDTSVRTRERAVSREERGRRTHRLLTEAHACDDGQERARLLREVVLVNRQVAEAVANRYRNRGVAAEDLTQTAYEGLVKAVLHFDPSVRPDLLTYAVPTIRGEIQRLFRDRSWMVRPPRRVQQDQWTVNQSIARLSQRLGREPTPAEIGADTGLEADQIHEALLAFGCFRPPSLDQPVAGESDLALRDVVGPVWDDNQSAAEARVVLSAHLGVLSAYDRELLFMRYFQELSLTEIGRRLEIYHVAVSRRLVRVLGALRTHIGQVPA